MACPVNVMTDRPHEDDSCTVVVPGTNHRYRDFQSGALPPGSISDTIIVNAVLRMEPCHLEYFCDTVIICAGLTCGP